MTDPNVFEIRATFLEHVFRIIKVNNGSITSWIRSPAHNAQVGGLPQSLHTIGLAVDAVFDHPNDTLAAMISARTAGLHWLKEPNHLHIQALPITPQPPKLYPAMER